MSEPTTAVGEERAIPRGSSLVLKTDLSGKIIYANAVLTETSGYALHELLGQTSNVFRHRDVPDAVFEHLWKTLKKGRPWRGLLKNACKNGDHFWSDIYIVPIWQKGRAVGFMSVHSQAAPAQILEAKAQYAFAKKTGRVAEESGVRPLRYLSIKRGVLTGILFVLAATVVSAWIGVHGLRATSQLVDELERQSNVSALLTKGDQHAAHAVSNILLAIQHAPSHSASGAQQGLAEQVRLVQNSAQAFGAQLLALESHRLKLTGASQGLEPLVPGLAAGAAISSDDIGRYLTAGRALVKDGLEPVASAMSQGQLEDVQELVVSKIGPMSNELNARSNALSDGLLRTSSELRRTVDGLYDTTISRLLYWSILTAAVVGLSGILFFRGTMKPLKRAMVQMRKIAEGHLSEKPDVFGFGETEVMTSTLATMQIQLKVMLDEIHLASNRVQEQVKRLNGEVISILNNTEDQFDKATQINEALERSGADTVLLASSALASHHLAKKLADESAISASSDLAELVELVEKTYQTASLANLNALGAEEIRRLSGAILNGVVQNRENSNNSWAIGQRLEDTSVALNGMLDKLD